MTYIAGPIELFRGLLIMIGLFVRPTAFLLLPIHNRGELAALYCFRFLFSSAAAPS